MHRHHRVSASLAATSSASPDEGTDATARTPSPAHSRWAQLLARGHRRAALVANSIPCAAPDATAPCASSPSSPIPPSSKASSATWDSPTDPHAALPLAHHPRQGHRREALVPLRPDPGLGTSSLPRGPALPGVRSLRSIPPRRRRYLDRLSSTTRTSASIRRAPSRPIPTGPRENPPTARPAGKNPCITMQSEGFGLHDGGGSGSMVAAGLEPATSTM